MKGSFDAAQRRALEQALAAGEEPVCPACGTRLVQQPVTPPAEVAYVRHRVLVICPSCRRGAGIDVRRAT